MPKMVSAPFSVFKRVLRSRNQDVVFVLHKPGCDDCRKFIQNPYLSMEKITGSVTDPTGASIPNRLGREVKMVKVNVGREKDMADLERLIQVNRGTQWPVVIVMRKGEGILKKLYKPTWKNVHAHIERLRHSGRSAVANMSLAKLQRMLADGSHTAKLTPLGSAARIAMDVRRPKGAELVCLHTALTKNSLVMFKRDGCGYCRKLHPHFMQLAKESPFRRELGFYTVDTDEHYGKVKMILKKLSDRHGYPQDLVNMPGVPTLALFMGEYAPLLLNGRTYKQIKDEIEKQMTHVFVDIKNPTERVTVEKVADQNAAVLFIDSRHAPCLKMLNRVRNALDKLETNSQISTKGIKVYAFNVRNHQDIWDKIRNDYKIMHNGVELDVLSLPQIVYFFQRRRVPAVRKNITKLDSEQIAHDISQQYKLQYKPHQPSTGADSIVSYLTSVDTPDHEYEHDFSRFEGGAQEVRMARVERELQTTMDSIQRVERLLQSM